MKKLIYLFIALLIFQSTLYIGRASAQTAKVYRAGTLLSSHSTLLAACSAANMIGDSILLSAHTFYEHDIPAIGGQTWQGTYTPTDSTIIDAQSLGRVFSVSPINKYRAINIRNIICTHGKTIFPEVDGGGINRNVDSVVLKGNTIVRNCFATRNGGGTISAHVTGRSKLLFNHADSIGGGAYLSSLNDSVEISNNTASYGGGIGGGKFTIGNKWVRISNNIATVGGGGIYGIVYSGEGFQVTNNQAPIGAGVCGKPSLLASISGALNHAYIFNPSPSGSRQNEVFIDGGIFYFTGTWFGKSDTMGLIQQSSKPNKKEGMYAKANWSVNRGASLGKNDTLFPVGAAFTYSDGSPLPLNSCAWLVGNFSSTLGTMLTPNPKTSPTDTMSSLFRTYIYGKGESGTKSIDYLCWVDQDTFRSTQLVWGRDTAKLGIVSSVNESNVMVYPNPTKDVLNITGSSEGSTVLLLDISGKQILKQIFNASHNVFSIKHLDSGIYFLKIEDRDGRQGVTKIVKE